MAKFTYRFQAMGGPAKFVIDQEVNAQVSQAINAAEQEIRRLERIYSRYLPDSEVSRINSCSGEWVEISDETQGLLDYAQSCFEQSSGLFDITSGVYRTIWNFAQPKLPSEAEIKKIKELVGWQKVQRDKHRIKLAKGQQIDFGGLVKEYAVDAAAAVLKMHGIKHALIDLAGDMYLLGSQANGKPWSIGVVNPDQTEQSLAQVQLCDMAITTSGNYQRFVEIDGQRYCHIINPLTGWPVKKLASVSVVAPNCVVAGAMTTIAMLKESQAEEWLANAGVPWLLRKADGELSGRLQAE